MSDEQRSILIDVCYSQLYLTLCGQNEGFTSEELKHHLEARKGSLENLTNPFGSPSPASLKTLQSGRIQLPDGLKPHNVSEAEKDCVIAISSKLNIDEIQAFVLFKSWTYNQALAFEGLFQDAKQTVAEVIPDLLVSIEPFYWSERLFATKLLGPVFRAYGDDSDLLSDLAVDFLPGVFPDPAKLALNILDAYIAQNQEQMPTTDPKLAVQATKRNLCQQLALLELFFWVMWSYAPCSGPIVVKAFQTAYETTLGTNHSLMLLDEESQQLIQNCAAFWILITIEVLELETIGEVGRWEFEENKEMYISSPESLSKIHDIVTSNTNSQFACSYLAWTYVLSRLSLKVSSKSPIPSSYHDFLKSINAIPSPPTATARYTKDPEPVHIQMCKALLAQDEGLFNLLLDLLTKSPVFVTSISWKTSSGITESNTLAYRSTLKGLVTALLDLTPAENIPDFEGLLNVWAALFGRSESAAVAGICMQFWNFDWHWHAGGSEAEGGAYSRRALIDMARTRFPVMPSPLMKLLRAMTGSGYLDTDPLALGVISEPTATPGPDTTVGSATGTTGPNGISLDRMISARFVYYFFEQLPSFTQIIPLSHCTGPHALYERVGSSSSLANISSSNLNASFSTSNITIGTTYVNLRPLRLPGGSILPAKSAGTVVSADSGEYVIVSWKHQHSGWRLMLELLGWYVARRQGTSAFVGTGFGTQWGEPARIVGGYASTALTAEGGGGGKHSHKKAPPVQMKIEDMGIDITEDNDERVVTDALDLLRSVIQSNPALCDQVVGSLEGTNVVDAASSSGSGNSDATINTNAANAQAGGPSGQGPDLVQLVTMILEEALSRSGGLPGAGWGIGQGGRQHPSWNDSSNSATANGGPRSPWRMRLVTSALSVLAALLVNPVYSNRVWLYIRSTSVLFGAANGFGGNNNFGAGGYGYGNNNRGGQEKSYASAAIAMERSTGEYTMTLALLHLVQQLMFDAAVTVQPADPPGNSASAHYNPQAAKLQQVKEEVLLRAIRFVHNEIWIEHLGWRYNQLGDRFEIARRIAVLYKCVLDNFPPFLPGSSPRPSPNSNGQGIDMDMDTPAASATPSKPYALLSQAVSDILLFKATTSTITPLVSSITNGSQMVRMLQHSRRFGDERNLDSLLETLLALARGVLNVKLGLLGELASGGNVQPQGILGQVSLLEQALCARVVGNGQEGHVQKQDPIDVLAGYVKDRDIGTDVPYQAIRLLTTLAKSLSLTSSLSSVLSGSALSSSASALNLNHTLNLTTSLAMSTSLPTPTTMIGHLSNPEAVVASFIGIVQHPFDEIDLRIAVWKFVALVVDVEPALGGLFVAGRFRIPERAMVPKHAADGEKKDAKGKGKENGGGAKEKKDLTTTATKLNERNALTAAHDSLLHWKQLWEYNPQLLSAVLYFMTIVWSHALEHKVSIQPLREDAKFWRLIVGIVKEEIGPTPEYETKEYVYAEKSRHSECHEAVSAHAYRTLAKAYAVRLISLDVGFWLGSKGSKAPVGSAKKKPESFSALEPELRSEDDISDLLSEAAPSPYAPKLHDEVTAMLERDFPGLLLPQTELQDPVTDRFYGDRFVFSMTLVQDRLHAYKPFLEADGMEDPIDVATKAVLSVNLNLSLTHAQTTLAESWENLLRVSIPYLRGDTKIRKSLMNVAASISGGIALEKRRGEMMAAIHGTRLALLLGILEVAWFSSPSTAPATSTLEETKSFIELTKNLKNIVNNEAQNPVKSFMSGLPNPFHRTLLQLLFFFSKEARVLLNRPKALKSDQRLTIGETTEAALGLAIEGLRITFVSAQSRRDLDLDKDMELLASVFEQCTKTDISPSSTHWLAKCQETDVMRASLELFVRTDLSGLSDVPVLLALKHPLYAPHILLFHMAVVSNPIAAERFAGEGLLAAYSNNSISPAISSGRVDVAIPELPGDRSSVHLAYCSMLAVVSTVITALGRHNHYFDAEASGFVQVYGDQISRALSWTVGDTITIPLMEEIEQVVNLFYATAASVPHSVKSNVAVEKVLRVFTTHALLLLQQINYAVTHPNHLASLFEAVTAEERALHEKSQRVSDPLKRPLIAQLVYRMFRLSSNILGTLVLISKAETVLCNPEEDWPLGEALVVPHSKVVVGEPASLGTLLELGNCSLDILRDFVNRPAGQALTSNASTQTFSPLDVRQGVITARRNLESILLYAVTQLTMWISKPEFESTGQDTDAEDPQAMDIQRSEGALKERRMITSSAPRPSTISMAERLRRGMTGEMASDLQALLNRAKPIVAKCNGVIGKESVDITPILASFLHARISVNS